jgi:hypothetical protein
MSKKLMMSVGDPSQVLDVLRDVLVEHMDDNDSLPHYQIQSAVFIGGTGRLIGEEQVLAGNDAPAGLRLTMRSGHEYDLTLRNSCSEVVQEDEEDSN